MPTFDVYRETTTREHYRIEAETAEAAFAIYEKGDAHLSNDEVIDAQPPTVALDGVLILDTATIPAEADEPETQTFTCKIGVNARAYFDFEIDAANANDVLTKLRDGLAKGILLDGDMSFEYEVGDTDFVVLHIRDEDENDHHELVPLDYEPFDMPPAVVNFAYGESTFDQFARLRAESLNLIEERGSVLGIISHLEAKLSPKTYSRRIYRAAELKAAIEGAREKATERHAARLASNPPTS